MISFHREGPTLPGRSSRLADHPHIKGYRPVEGPGGADLYRRIALDLCPERQRSAVQSSTAAARSLIFLSIGSK